ncbi:hypothetical protein AWC13_15525 [Mycobacterium kubicae]|nr:hypothetical protein A5725_22605 [Mycobacterium kubicae]ORV97644.1 hypothetical protein AWC13_15525 [Mycobacterium kubicae]
MFHRYIERRYHLLSVGILYRAVGCTGKLLKSCSEGRVLGESLSNSVSGFVQIAGSYPGRLETADDSLVDSQIARCGDLQVNRVD